MFTSGVEISVSHSKDISNSDHTEILTRIVENYILKGVVDAGKIAKALNMKRADVVMYIEEWKAIARNSNELQERSRELLIELDQGYSKAIKEYWDIIDDSDTPIHVKNSAIKNYTEAMATRHSILEKAGIYDSMEEKQEVLDTQEKVNQIRKLLQEVADKYPQSKNFILTELSQIFGKAESTGVVEVDVLEIEED